MSAFCAALTIWSGGCGPRIEEASSARSGSATAAVEVGLDRVAAGEVKELEGKKLGLIVHAASVTLDGRSAVAVFRERGLDLVRLYGPEHGRRSVAAAGEAVADEVDRESGLPVISLYPGGPDRPSAEDFAGLDAVVFDLQDAGVRFYTYAALMLRCLDAAAEGGVELVVLDRPNPLGGRRMSGPFRGPDGEVRPSLVNLLPGPLIHGLTMGEMARWANERKERPARLSVVPMRGWRREMTWADTGRTWVPPSPNLRSADAALAYPGIALLEASNVSEGRGTVAPFLRFGAPWIDPAAARIEAPGFRLTPARFTPEASPAAPEPKYLGEPCEGFEVEVVDRRAADPFGLGVATILALRADPRFEWRRGGEALDWLVGTTALRRKLESARSLEEVVALDGERRAEWRRDIAPLLLYD
ncbi:MAG: DUF1343 domain-containing protein [Acidobacteria bacterium]|nr:DUF1343 domain-containing protein [Acidobacteriota bacterium]